MTHSSLPSLTAYEIELRPLRGELPVEAVRANALNGLFYSELGRRFSSWVNELHEPNGSRPQPFSLALNYSNGMVRGFRACALEAGTGARIAEVWHELAERQAQVRLGPAQMVVAGVRPGAPGAYEYDQLLAESPAAKAVRLRFLSPVRLKVMGHTTLLPAPRTAWQFYALRWQTYAPGAALPPELVRWVEWQVHALEVQLETCFAYVEQQVEWKGVVGEVAYQAFNDQRDLPPSRFGEYLRAWQALAALAEFCGTGEKVTKGMGRTVRARVEGFWQETPPARARAEERGS